MSIHFCLNTHNEIRASLYLIVMCFAGILHMQDSFILQDSQISVAMFKMPNMTSIPQQLYEDIPYNDCRCSVVPAEKCLKEGQLKMARIIILSIFSLQVCLLWEFLWLSGDRIYIFAYAYWITSMLIFLAISVLIHQSNYYYDETSWVLLCTGLLLWANIMLHLMSQRISDTVEFGNPIL